MGNFEILFQTDEMQGVWMIDGDIYRENKTIYRKKKHTHI